MDRYFMASALEGKLRAGPMHMPARKGVLPPETRSFTETRRLPPRRTLPDPLPAVAH